MSDCKSSPLVCPGDVALLQCLIGCALEGVVGGAGGKIILHRFDEAGTIVDDVYDGTIERAFHAPEEYVATFETDIREEDFTPFGNRSTGLEDDNIEKPDVIAYIPLGQLDTAGVVLDPDNRDEYDLTINRRPARYSVIGIHYPQAIGGMELTVEVYLIEKG